MGLFNLTRIDSDIIFCKDAFSPEIVSSMRNVCDDIIQKTGAIDLATGDNKTRKAFTSYLPRIVLTKPIYQQIGELARTINSTHYGLDISGFIENGLIYTVYDTTGDHYDWHTDKTDRNGTRKDFVKMTVVVQLSDPSEYEGGVVEIMTDGIISVPKTQGLAYAIPGWTPHRVTPVTRGTRKSLVVWTAGTKFK